jgi:NAD/NADP transhydrogenase alpha subunit
MKIKQIIVFKESRVGEGRVALTPDAVSLLGKKGIPILVESAAGQFAEFTDQEYIRAGASIFTLSAPLPANSFILRVKRPTKERENIENSLFSDNTVMMGFLDPLDDDISHIKRWKSLGLKLISLELLPLSADDPKNAQAAMSHMAGRLALQDAVNRYQGPLVKKVSVIGTGPAGLAAAFAAKELHLSVQLFGRKEQFRQLIEAAGIKYIVLPEHEPREFLGQYLKDQTIIITAARVIGKKTPLLIAESVFKLLPDYSVIVDLSTGEGGSVKGSKSDQTVTIDRHISIINVSGYPKAEPQVASKAFSDCMVHLLFELITGDKNIDVNHPLLKCQQESVSTKDKRIV